MITVPISVCCYPIDAPQLLDHLRRATPGEKLLDHHGNICTKITPSRPYWGGGGESMRCEVA